MSNKGWQQKAILTPRGAWESTAERRQGSPSRASIMQNCRVAYGAVTPRPGTATITSATGKTTCFYNWLAPNGNNYVFSQQGLDVRQYLQGGATSTAYTAPGGTRASSFSDIDIWTYFCGYDVNNVGTYQVKITDGNYTDTAFRGPLVFAAGSAADSGAGQCTAGLHNFGFVYQNRTGFSGKPTILVGGVALTVTLAAGLRKVNVSVTVPAQTDGGGAATLFLIVTRADNPNQWYFLPAATGGSNSVEQQPVPLNAIATLNFVFDLSDEDLAASAVPANGPNAQPNQFLLLTQDAMGAGPFNPNFVVAYGQRMCYGNGTGMYVSDISAPQQITGDQNLVTMPNQRKIAYAFQLPGSTDLYVTGDGWTSRVTDNSDVPATWAVPFKISDTLGSLFPENVCWKTGGDYAWMATGPGVYRFTGGFDPQPITYLNSGLDPDGNPIGWSRVNWNAAYAVQVKDDILGRKLYVAVPLDGATEPTHVFCIDYRNGMTFDTCDISIDSFDAATFSAISVVKEIATGQTNLWIGPSAAGSVTHLDPATHNDSGTAIHQIWESGLVRSAGETDSSMIAVGWMDIWARGNAAIDAFLITIFNMNRTRSVVVPLFITQGVKSTLELNPEYQYMSRFDLNQLNNYTVRFETNVVDTWFELSGFTPYTRASRYNR